MKILLAQTNPTPRDFTGNVAQIKQMYFDGLTQHADIVVLPELSICGYLSRDLVYTDGFIDANLEALQQIVMMTKGEPRPFVVVGYIDRNHTGVGKPFRNMAAVIANGTIICTYAKQLLPFYDVFDEGRYFEPGKDLAVFEIDGQKWGLCICEDVWNDKGADDYNYINNPLEAYRKIGVKNIISINSSPYVHGKVADRVNMLRKSVQDGTLVYVNQIGGQDELVFDGHSFVVADGNLEVVQTSNREPASLMFEYPAPKNHLLSFTEQQAALNAIATNDEKLYEALVVGLRDYIKKSGFQQVAIASSGGIDSAVVIALAADAIGADNVHAIRMPSVISSKGSLEDALQLHQNVGCHDYIYPIDHIPMLQKLAVSTEKIGQKPFPVAVENVQARLRGIALLYVSNAFGYLPLTTGNKSELAVGYCTIFGDMAGGYAPINDLYKLQVYAMANYINERHQKEIVPQAIISKAPSAELSPNQTDEASLLPYPILDRIIQSYIEDHVDNLKEFKQVHTKNALLAGWCESPKAEQEYKRIIRLIDNNEFKRRQAAPGTKVSKVAFGTGRRLPIVKGQRA